jgi:hypothetical protein
MHGDMNTRFDQLDAKYGELGETIKGVAVDTKGMATDMKDMKGSMTGMATDMKDMKGSMTGMASDIKVIREAAVPREGSGG